MDTIYHEKQIGSLCAQHCLNNLLQSHYYTEVDLATVAQQCDELERATMAEGGTDSAAYRQFLEQPSQNFDDSGFFSVQVLSRALDTWALNLVPFTSQESVATQARNSPQSMQAYICNLREHWFTIRRLGLHWFNLNSLLTKPEHVSETYLSTLLAQLQWDGYSVFLVVGDLPQCTADDALLTDIVVPPSAKYTTSLSESDSAELERAIALSLEQEEPPAQEEVRIRRQAFLDSLQPSGQPQPPPTTD